MNSPNGAEILIRVSAYMDPWGATEPMNWWTTVNRCRALENTAFVVAANQGASLRHYPPYSWPGGSQVVDYDGHRVLLGISTVGLADTFRRGAHADYVRQALIDVLGVDVDAVALPVVAGHDLAALLVDAPAGARAPRVGRRGPLHHPVGALPELPERPDVAAVAVPERDPGPVEAAAAGLGRELERDPGRLQDVRRPAAGGRGAVPMLGDRDPRGDRHQSRRGRDVDGCSGSLQAGGASLWDAAGEEGPAGQDEAR